MRISILLIASALILAGCERESFEQKIFNLEAMRRAEYAGIVRQKGECQAIAIEFNNDPQMNRICQDSLRMAFENAHRTIADIDKRIGELRRIECSKPGRFDGVRIDC